MKSTANVATALAIAIGLSTLGAGCTVSEETRVRRPVVEERRVERPVVRERVVVPEAEVRTRVIVP